MTAIAERVAAGAAFLDEREPGWWRDVDPISLDLADCGLCVLGQLHENYEEALMGFDLSDQRSKELGFMEEGPLKSNCDYDGLTAEWKRVIGQRRAGTS